MTTRERFEEWVSASGRAHLLERDHPHLWYKDLTVTAWWTAWQEADRQAVSHAIKAMRDEIDWRKVNGEYDFEKGLWAAIDELEVMLSRIPH